MSMNKSVAGYHMLMLLSNLDGDFNKVEGDLMIDYMREALPEKFNLDEEIDFLSKLDTSDYFNHFSRMMDSFYSDSSPKERAAFIDIAVRMITADNKITNEENIFLNELMNTWDPDGLE